MGSKVSTFRQFYFNLDSIMVFDPSRNRSDIEEHDRLAAEDKVINGTA